jgi:hypothetical protein
MLDRLPAWARHLLIALISALLAWAASDLVPILTDQGGLAAVAGAVLTSLLLVLTPLVRQYGVGARRDKVDR